MNLTAPAGWYAGLAQHLGSAYLGYEFVQGTEQEVEFLFNGLPLKRGDRVLDVGMGPGRHAVEFAKRGVDVVGIDIAPRFIEMARERADEADVALSVFQMDAAELPFEEEFDAVISICEGAFGLGGDDLKILRAITRALKKGGHCAVAAPHVFYMLENMKDTDDFDPVTSVFRRSDEVLGEGGTSARFDMWNSCYTARELEWIANGAGLDPQFVAGIAPGDFKGQPPKVEHPELLLIARKP